MQTLTEQVASGFKAQDFKLEELINQYNSDSSRVTNSERKQLVREAS